jgi:hypothetical protein
LNKLEQAVAGSREYVHVCHLYLSTVHIL